MFLLVTVSYIATVRDLLKCLCAIQRNVTFNKKCLDTVSFYRLHTF